MRHERNVLGNDNNVYIEAIAEIGNPPASRVLWISNEKSVAERYNPGSGVIAFDVALCPIIGDGGEQGYLLLLPQASNL